MIDIATNASIEMDDFKLNTFHRINKLITDNNTHKFEELIKNNKYIFEKNDNITLLFICIYKNKLNFLKILKKNNINLNIFNKNGNTLLHIAIHTENIEIVKFLLTCNIDINFINKEDQQPIDIAILKHNLLITQLLLTKITIRNITTTRSNFEAFKCAENILYYSQRNMMMSYFQYAHIVDNACKINNLITDKYNSQLNRECCVVS